MGETQAELLPVLISLPLLDPCFTAAENHDYNHHATTNANTQLLNIDYAKLRRTGLFDNLTRPAC